MRRRNRVLVLLLVTVVLPWQTAAEPVRTLKELRSGLSFQSSDTQRLQQDAFSNWVRARLR